MVRHVVCQKYIDKRNALLAAEKLRALMGVVPSLRSMEVGIDELCAERSYDLVILATFDDMEGLHAYDAHPAHQEVRAFIHPLNAGSISVDYTF